MKRKIMLSLTVLALTALVGVGATLAWFTDSDTATNVITTGNVKIKIVETSQEPKSDYEYDEKKGITYNVPYMPGKVLSKEALIENTGSVPAYVRAKVVFLDENDQELTFNGVEPPQINYDVFKDYWSQDGGYYYYHQSLPSGAKTEYLFTTVTIPTSWGNEMSNIKFNIVIKAEAVQSDHTGATAKEAFALEGLDFTPESESPSDKIENPDDGSDMPDDNNGNDENGILPDGSNSGNGSNSSNGIQPEGEQGANGSNGLNPDGAGNGSEIPRYDSVIEQAEYYAEQYKKLKKEYDETPYKERAEVLAKINTLFNLAPTNTSTSFSNDTFHKKLRDDFNGFPTVAEEDLADELGFDNEQANRYYVNVYVSPNDKFAVIPFISTYSGNRGTGDQWKASYLRYKGTWYKPASDSGNPLNIDALRSGWSAISDQWTPID